MMLSQPITNCATFASACASLNGNSACTPGAVDATCAFPQNDQCASTATIGIAVCNTTLCGTTGFGLLSCMEGAVTCVTPTTTTTVEPTIPNVTSIPNSDHGVAASVLVAICFAIIIVCA